MLIYWVYYYKELLVTGYLDSRETEYARYYVYAISKTPLLPLAFVILGLNTYNNFTLTLYYFTQDLKDRCRSMPIHLRKDLRKRLFPGP